MSRFLVVLVFGTLACGEENGGSPSGSGGNSTGGSGGMTATGGGAGTSGAGGGQAGSGGAAGSGNTSGVLIVPDGGDLRDGSGAVIGDASLWLQLESSHYTVLAADPRQPDVPLEAVWVGRVRNIGAALVCPGQLSPKFYDADRNEIADLLPGYVYAPMYARAGEDVPRMCIEPGETGMVAAHQYPDGPIDLSEVTEVGYTVTGTMLTDATRRDWVTLSELALSGDVVSGLATNGDEVLSSWNIDVFGTDAGGLPVGFSDYSDGQFNIAPGTLLPFEMDPFGTPVQGFAAYYNIVL